jgi:hypothetical protein
VPSCSSATSSAGVAWYADHLASAIIEHGDVDPSEALTAAITQTADLHRDTCDLTHPGTPSAAVGLVQIMDDQLRYLVLGDVTVVIDNGDTKIVVTDDRINKTAQPERRAADALPAGSESRRSNRIVSTCIEQVTYLDSECAVSI